MKNMKINKILWTIVSVAVFTGMLQAAPLDPCDGQYVNWNGSMPLASGGLDWYKWTADHVSKSADGLLLDDLDRESRVMVRAFYTNKETTNYTTQYDFKFNNINAGQNDYNELTYIDGYITSTLSADIFTHRTFASGTDFPTVGNVDGAGVQIASGVWYRYIFERKYDKTYLTIQNLSTEAIVCSLVELVVPNPDRTTGGYDYIEFSVGLRSISKIPQGQFYVNNLKIGKIPAPGTISMLLLGIGLFGSYRKRKV